ncbi:hypothetical protein H112_04528 [Trichophyton rubrum D6]|nr:uncharacterized protein TERG_04303 [Trichophyton rubrum CBS 118892]EZF22683.1 hypothetical protein H100_04535 [Trichophyton rubrum MR850]EZF41727.1 hypothetical protein H102_04522 [Trichophyton rubrum CBS 100081]EZF52370.1 hypothetical protein H103_04531 [Trichophyton rubrum CBS 288.86]EZF62983.1 hypothetical protein H104_04518 [Trichophyton rubrum CBS 289.86]EZF73479.1 hypothetical protein H105_04544 [Trichophyton soudanense CBS 452.61]EZF84267.1 hypothetical protein H110_04522 [Trichophy
MPRPDLETLGVQYRRIPVLSIGKDVYCDTRLIIKKLEEQFPDGRLGATDGEGQALENLLETWSTDGGLFLNAVLLMPLDLPSLRDPAFLKDRSTFLTGPKWKMEDMPSLRGEAMVQVKRAFDFLESTLLADGRDWLRKTEKPTLADIHGMSLICSLVLLDGFNWEADIPLRYFSYLAIWPLDWVLDMGSLEDSIVTEASHPKVFAWIARFRQALSHAKGRLEEMLVSGSEVLDGLQHESFAQSDAEFDDSDPLGLEKGEEVLVWPTDSGSTHQDAGTLIGLNSKEIVLQRKTADNRFDIRIHFPRLNFKVVSAAHVQQTKL